LLELAKKYEKSGDRGGTRCYLSRDEGDSILLDSAKMRERHKGEKQQLSRGTL